jgi:hypothetical protein
MRGLASFALSIPVKLRYFIVSPVGVRLMLCSLPDGGDHHHYHNVPVLRHGYDTAGPSHVRPSLQETPAPIHHGGSSDLGVLASSMLPPRPQVQQVYHTQPPVYHTPEASATTNYPHLPTPDNLTHTPGWGLYVTPRAPDLRYDQGLVHDSGHTQHIRK